MQAEDDSQNFGISIDEASPDMANAKRSKRSAKRIIESDEEEKSIARSSG